MGDVINNLLAGDAAIKVNVNINDEDLTKIIVGVSIALIAAVAIGVILAKKVN